MFGDEVLIDPGAVEVRAADRPEVGPVDVLAVDRDGARDVEVPVMKLSLTPVAVEVGAADALGR